MSKIQKILCLSIIIALVLCFLLVIPKLSRSGSNAKYVSMAQSIGEGGGLRYASHPAKLYYPRSSIVLPILLTPLVKLFPNNFRLFKIVPILFFIISLIFLTKILPRFTSKQNTKIILLIIATSPLYLVLATRLLTEIVYLGLSLITILVLLNFEKNNSYRDIILAAICVTAAFFTRTEGVILIGASLVYFIIKKQKKILVLPFIFLLLISPWLLNNMIIEGDSDTNYVDLFITQDQELSDAPNINLFDLVQRFNENTYNWIQETIPTGIYYLVFQGLKTFNLNKIQIINLLGILLGSLITLVMVLGFMFKVSKRLGLIDIYIVLFFILYTTISFPQARRMISVLPFVLVYLFISIRKITKSKKIFSLIIGSIILFNVIADVGIIIREQTYEPPAWESYYQAAEWIKENTDKEDVIVSRKPFIFHFYAERPTMYYKWTENSKDLIDDIFKYGGTYVIVDQLKEYPQTKEQLIPTIEKYKEKFQLVHETELKPVTKIYKIV